MSGNNIDEKLGLISFEANKEKHIKIDGGKCAKCGEKPCLRFCPAKRFTLEDGKIKHDHEGCLECGSCKIACPNGGANFNYPQGGFGAQYKYG